MKAKFNITIPEVKITHGDAVVEVMNSGSILTEVEFSATEIKDLYDIQKGMLKELPSLIKEVAVDVCKSIVEAKAECTEELMKDKDFREMKENDERIRQEIEGFKERVEANHEEIVERMKSFGGLKVVSNSCDQTAETAERE